MVTLVDPWSTVEVLFKNPFLGDPRDAKFIFISELHDREDMRRVHSAFMASVVLQNTLLLTESCKAKVVLEGERKINFLRDYLIPEEAQEKLTLMGWDYYGEDLERTRAECEEKRADLRLLIESISSPEFTDPEKKRELNDRISQKIKELKDEDFWVRKIDDHVIEAIKNPDYLSRFSVERQIRIGVAISDFVKSRGLPLDPSYAENIDRIEASLKELLWVDFAKRTEAMIETLHHVKENPLYNRVVLIAGKAHLQELARASHDPRLKLTIPAIVVTMKESG
jgi:hypothetical protein